eukprot:6629341-Karenia_brevis.AAC.1
MLTDAPLKQSKGASLTISSRSSWTCMGPTARPDAHCSGTRFGTHPRARSAAILGPTWAILGLAWGPI